MEVSKFSGWCQNIPQIRVMLPPPPLWWVVEVVVVVEVPPQHHFTTTITINISCVAIYAVLSQNQLSRDLHVFDVKFLGWKWFWCQKWQINCINLVEHLNFVYGSGDYLHCFVAFWFCKKIEFYEKVSQRGRGGVACFHTLIKKFASIL